jgi:hypothetical protein
LALLMMAAYKPPGPLKTLEYVQVSATTLTSPVATAWMKVGGYNQLTFELALVDADSSITRLDWSCVSATDDTTPTGSSATFAQKTLSISSGVATYVTLQSQMAVAGSENFIINMPINYRWLKCTFSAGAGTPGAPDTLQIDARAQAGG